MCGWTLVGNDRSLLSLNTLLSMIFIGMELICELVISLTKNTMKTDHGALYVWLDSSWQRPLVTITKHIVVDDLYWEIHS